VKKRRGLKRVVEGSFLGGTLLDPRRKRKSRKRMGSLRSRETEKGHLL